MPAYQHTATVSVCDCQASKLHSPYNMGHCNMLSTLHASREQPRSPLGSGQHCKQQKAHLLEQSSLCRVGQPWCAIELEYIQLICRDAIVCSSLLLLLLQSGSSTATLIAVDTSFVVLVGSYLWHCHCGCSAGQPIMPPSLCTRTSQWCP